LTRPRGAQADMGLIIGPSDVKKGQEPKSLIHDRIGSRPLSALRAALWSSFHYGVFAAARAAGAGGALM
jgi:hypothetical protein